MSSKMHHINLIKLDHPSFTSQFAIQISKETPAPWVVPQPGTPLNGRIALAGGGHIVDLDDDTLEMVANQFNNITDCKASRNPISLALRTLDPRKHCCLGIAATRRRIELITGQSRPMKTILNTFSLSIIIDVSLNKIDPK